MVFECMTMMMKTSSSGTSKKSLSSMWKYSIFAESYNGERRTIQFLFWFSNNIVEWVDNLFRKNGGSAFQFCLSSRKKFIFFMLIGSFQMKFICSTMMIDHFPNRFLFCVAWNDKLWNVSSFWYYYGIVDLEQSVPFHYTFGFVDGLKAACWARCLVNKSGKQKILNENSSELDWCFQFNLMCE